MSHAASDSRPSPLLFSSFLLIFGGVGPFREAFPPSPKEAQRRSADVEDPHETSLQTRRDGGRGAFPDSGASGLADVGRTHPPVLRGGLSSSSAASREVMSLMGFRIKFLLPTIFTSG